MLYVIIKLVHFSALLMAGGAVIGSGLLMKQVMANPGPPPPMVQNTMKILGMIGLAAIILLWLSGLGLAYGEYGGLAIGRWFDAKLFGAAIVLVCVIAMRVISTRAARAGVPPDMKLLKTLSMVSRGGLALAIVAAVVQFR